ncbi:hypothetical protein Poli38472_001117 [Pythium oligandrum]|uniref:Uncharacterized protein n=1 Tax=Pythium oligandrum TaxID=41045 RepID=A0A8K1CSD5_PYTOL|nr:hypothetical protein Poli38472_001117 [Pythium oligandrum]|eukprot:TMW68961.1 hypothetical protein Poli38472_001117 [Pythium oligandrum]
MTDSSGDVELLTGTSIRPQDVAGNSTLTGGTCEYYPAVDGKCAEPRNCADCLLKEGCAIDTNGLCTDANWTDPSLDYRKAQALGLVLPASNNSDVKQRWFFPAFTTSYCSASDSICAQCRENKFWASSVDVYNRGYDSRYCVGANGCVCVSVCEAGTWRVTNHEECLISNDRRDHQMEDADRAVRLNTLMFAILGFLGALVILVGGYEVVRRRRRLKIARLAEQREARCQALQAEREQSRATAVLGLQWLNLSGWGKDRRELIDKEHTRLASEGEGSTTVETAAAFVSVEDATQDAVVATLERPRNRLH